MRNAKRGETPRRRPHQRPILEPKKIGHKIDTSMPRKDWTIFKEQSTNYGGSSNTQGQHHMVGHQTPHEYTSRNRVQGTPDVQVHDKPIKENHLETTLMMILAMTLVIHRIQTQVMTLTLMTLEKRQTPVRNWMKKIEP